MRRILKLRNWERAPRVNIDPINEFDTKPFEKNARKKILSEEVNPITTMGSLFRANFPTSPLPILEL